jgi:hypothetical protein
VGGSFDDYVPPKDAYVHNLLTSSAPGIDHFGHLAPLSRANEQLMYGPTYHKIINMIYGHKFSKVGFFSRHIRSLSPVYQVLLTPITR